MLADAPVPIDADCVGFTGRMRLFTDGKAEPVSAHPHPLRTAIGASHSGGAAMPLVTNRFPSGILKSVFFGSYFASLAFQKERRIYRGITANLYCDFVRRQPCLIEGKRKKEMEPN